MDLSNIKKELIENLKTDNEDIKNKAIEEIETMSNILYFDRSKTNLEAFYDIWKKNIDREQGEKNEQNSYLVYALGMSNKKPNDNEEFLKSRRVFARASFPDVDIDFDDDNRDDVNAYMAEKYGKEKVGNIGTYNKLKMRSCIRRLVKALDCANAFLKGKDAYITENEEIAQEVSNIFKEYSNALGVIKTKDEEGNEVVVKNVKDAYYYLPKFKNFIDKFPNLMDYIVDLEGLISSYGVHASGIVIGNCPLDELAPMRKSRKDGVYSTQYAYEDLESIGLIKFDNLSIATLTIIKKCVKLIKKNYDIDLDVKNLPLDDEKTLKLYASGKLNGIFQCETSNMQKVMRDIKVDSFEDVVAAIALYRPGPLDNIPDYCAVKNGEKNINYFHPSLKPFLKDIVDKTHGILVYQEQIMAICNKMANFDIDEGYAMIKAVGKKKLDLMESFEKQFIDGCIENKIDKNVSKQYWDKIIIPFANYAFNKCLSGKMKIKDKNTNNFYKLEDIAGKTNLNIVLDSYLDGEIIEDELIEVFETGEKEIYEIKLDNGIEIECTLDHKFLCSDGKFHTVQDILDNDLEIIF